MDKDGIVLVMAGGIFNLGDQFFKPLIVWFEGRGYKNFHIVNYPQRTVPFKDGKNEQLAKLGLRTIKNDLCYLEDITFELKANLGKQKKIILITHSKSGVLGQVLAQFSSIDGLVALCPAPPRGISALSISGFWYMKSILLQIIKAWSTLIPVTRTYSDTIKGAFHPAMSRQDQDEAYDQLVWESGRVIWELAFDRFLHKQDHESPLFVDEQNVKIPLLFVGGDLDKIIKASVVRKIAKKYGTDAVIFKDVAHYPFWGKQGQAVFETIDNWIDDKILS